VPAAKGIAFLATSPRIRRVRARAVAASVMVAAAVVGVTCLVPMPLRSQAEGVIWIPDESLVRAGAEGFIDRVVVGPGTRVRRGDVLMVVRDPVLSTQVAVLEARLREWEARYSEQRPTDRVKAEIIKEELRYVADSLRRAREREAELTIRSRDDGSFVAPLAHDLPGRFVRQGELLGHVIDRTAITVRVVVPQETIDLVRHRTRGVEVRLAERVAEMIPASFRREVPAAMEQLPSVALGSLGGGRIAVDLSDPGGVKTVQRVFQFDLELPVDTHVVNLGGRVYVRFDHGWEPLVQRWYRQLRQLFLARFNV
jgi:putative peptide zinc metalloprotease protein